MKTIELEYGRTATGPDADGDLFIGRAMYRITKPDILAMLALFDEPAVVKIDNLPKFNCNKVCHVCKIVYNSAYHPNGCPKCREVEPLRWVKSCGDCLFSSYRGLLGHCTMVETNRIQYGQCSGQGFAFWKSDGSGRRT